MCVSKTLSQNYSFMPQKGQKGGVLRVSDTRGQGYRILLAMSIRYS